MYNFDEHIDRKSTEALSVEGFREYIFRDKDMEFPFSDDEFIRMWVADMDFKVADEILDGIRERLEKGILGYTGIYSDEYYEIFSDWCRKRYDWSFDKENLVISEGVVFALQEISGIVTDKDDKILINTPAYGPFRGAATFNKRECIYSPLIKKDGKFTIDFEDLNNKVKDAKLYIFCNPHNPTGRVWTLEELEKIARIIKENDLWVISDEIHCDLLRCGEKHIPLAKVLGDYDKIITCMAPSKTFNLAGMKFSNVIINDKDLMKKWKKRNFGDVNPLSLAAAKAAYSKGEKWLEELKGYLDGNFKVLKELLNKHLQKVDFDIPKATYLAWVDLGEYFKDEDISKFMAYEAGVLVEGARNFVDNGDGYIRMNIACPRDIMTEGVKRMAEAIKKREDK